MFDEYEKSIIQAFHRLYYKHKEQTWKNMSWLGIPLMKCPLDLWIYQEILCTVQPDVIVETGTWKGGSSLFLAGICDLLGRGRVITIDCCYQINRPVHARITYLTGSSVSREMFESVKTTIQLSDKVMVILDSDHHKDHVAQELKLYSQLVTPGSYLIVEDTNLNGNPVEPDFGPGPREAVEEFLQMDETYSIDQSCEKFLITASPSGYLKKSGNL